MKWGNWYLDIETLTLCFKGSDYYIDLELIDSSAQMLDWIFQIAEKTTYTAKDAKDLLRALSDIFDPQANYCPSGTNKRANGSKLVKAYIARVDS